MWTDKPQYLNAEGHSQPSLRALVSFEAHLNMEPANVMHGLFCPVERCGTKECAEGCSYVLMCVEGGGGAGNCPADILVIFYTLPSVLLCVCRPVCRSVGRWVVGMVFKGLKPLSPTYLAAGRGCDRFGCTD